MTKINYIPYLDKGFVGLISHMGNDSSIAQSARVSYGGGTTHARKDEHLIRYLLKHKHTSPFEMVQFRFHIKAPLFVARQVVRHRTSSWNEISARYSIMSNCYYTPTANNIKAQSSANKQGRDGDINNNDKNKIIEKLNNNYENSNSLYNELLGTDVEGVFSENYPGLSRELARLCLPVSMYTEWYWSINLHNLFHFLKLRLDDHAQYETQELAKIIYKIIKNIVPVASDAFEEYIFNSESFSKTELKVIKQYISNVEEIINLAKEKGLTGRELSEFKKKIS